MRGFVIALAAALAIPGAAFAFHDGTLPTVHAETGEGNGWTSLALSGLSAGLTVELTQWTTRPHSARSDLYTSNGSLIVAVDWYSEDPAASARITTPAGVFEMEVPRGGRASGARIWWGGELEGECWVTSGMLLAEEFRGFELGFGPGCLPDEATLLTFAAGEDLTARRVQIRAGESFSIDSSARGMDAWFARASTMRDGVSVPGALGPFAFEAGLEGSRTVMTAHGWIGSFDGDVEGTTTETVDGTTRTCRCFDLYEPGASTRVFHIPNGAVFFQRGYLAGADVALPP